MSDYLIIGSSAAGIGALSRIAHLAPTATITCISDEPEFPYNKCFLADFMSGIKPESAIYTKPRSFFEQHAINLMLGTRVTELLPHLSQVRTADGHLLSYKNLLLGCGSSPLIPAIPGIRDNKGIFTFHSLRDAQTMLQWVKTNKPQHPIILGAGLSGLECADSLMAYGVHPTIIELQPRMLCRHLDEGASRFIEHRMHKYGLRLIKEKAVREIVGNQGILERVMLDDGTSLPADMVVVAAGLRGNYDLAQRAGLEVSSAGIAVNEQMQTSHSSIWAAGDCVAVRDLLTDGVIPSATWPDAMAQGMVAGSAMVGEQRAYRGSVAMLSSSFFGLSVVVMGNVARPLHGYEIVVRENPEFYHAFAFDKQHLKGFILVNHTQMASRFKRALLTEEPVDINSIYHR